jgi:hypothetical protein
MDDSFLVLINVPCLAAGAAGGLLHAWRFEKAGAWEVVKYIIYGAVAANFIAPQLLKMLAVFPIGFVAFGVGMAGKHLCLAIELFFTKLDLFGKTKNE